MRAFMAEFRDFINKGNLLSIAIGFVMGAAFTTVVNALVDNVIMPIVAIPFGEPSFDSALVLTINDAQIRFGAYLTAVVNFVLIALALFLLMKSYNKMSAKMNGAGPDATSETPATPADVALLADMLGELRALRSDLNRPPSNPT